MKYLVLLCDGMSDEEQVILGNKTVMEFASTPNMDKLAKWSRMGFIYTTPVGFPPGSDICNLSIFGYDPRKFYTGRSPLEAASMGIELGPDDMAFRCNFVTLSQEGSVMEDFSAHHIEDKYASVAIDRLKEIFKNDRVEFHKGLSYRHLLVVRGLDLDVKTTPPHDISGQEIASFLPKGKDGAYLRDIMERAKAAFSGDTGKANSIWLWGEGKKPLMPFYEELYGKKGAVIAAVDLIKGIGKCAGMDVIKVPGVTGFIDTNFKGKAEYAVEALKDHDYVFVHVEAPDESGHMGSIENKVKSIEMIDSIMLPVLLKGMQQFEDFRILITPDHPTPVRLKTHTNEPVPALIYGTGVEPDDNTEYNEKIEPSFILKDGYKIAELFFSDYIK